MRAASRLPACLHSLAACVAWPACLKASALLPAPAASVHSVPCVTPSLNPSPPLPAPHLPQVGSSLGYHGLGLGALTRQVLGFVPPKCRKVTMSNWEARQLSARQVQYAALDAVITGHIFRGLRLWHASPSACTSCRQMLGAVSPSTAGCRCSLLPVAACLHLAASPLCGIHALHPWLCAPRDACPLPNQAGRRARLTMTRQFSHNAPC